jgi:hypothetical protein
MIMRAYSGTLLLMIMRAYSGTLMIMRAYSGTLMIMRAYSGTLMIMRAYSGTLRAFVRTMQIIVAASLFVRSATALQSCALERWKHKQTCRCSANVQ